MEAVTSSTTAGKLSMAEKIGRVALVIIFALESVSVILDPTVERIHNFLIFAFFAFIAFGALFLPRASMDGPLSLFWKCASGMNLFYLCSLLFLFFQSSRSAGIDFIGTYVDPSLELINYQEVSYASDCRLVSPESSNPFINVFNAFFDIFALAHFLGWFAKTIICRDLKLIMLASISFEIIEYSLRNVLNNFKECWWDHVIIDMFGCNMLGIICGFIFIDKFGLERYRWSLRSAPLQYSHWENFKQFWLNWDLSDLETRIFATLRPFLKIAFFFVLFQLNDLTLFFMKYMYHIPSSHFLVLSRLWIVGSLSVNAAKEYFEFIKHRSKFRRINILLLISIVATEIALILKHHDNEFAHAYLDTEGQILLGGLVGLFSIIFVKIAISDVIRKLKGLPMKSELQIPTRKKGGDRLEEEKMKAK